MTLVSVVLAILMAILAARKRKGAVQRAARLDNEGAGPNPTVPRAGQLETTSRARGAPLELPKHLRLGVTLPGMRELLSELPCDAVEQVNLHNAKYPRNKSVNGYINQFFFALKAKGKEGQPGDGLAVCERLQKRVAHVRRPLAHVASPTCGDPCL